MNYCASSASSLHRSLSQVVCALALCAIGSGVSLAEGTYSPGDARVCDAASGELLAFPGASGFGRFAKGGRGGRVVTVDTTEDIVDPDDDAVSLREALETMTGPRTVVFAVGGVFEITPQADRLQRISMYGDEDSDVTVACQSAPLPGVIIKSGGIRISGGAHDIVMRHCRIRNVDEGAPNSESSRAVTVTGDGARDMIFDHMSLSWATDENYQVYVHPDAKAGISNITLSNSVVVEGDADSSHPNSKKTPYWYSHAEGPSCNNNSPNYRPEGCSIVNNFIAHNSSRNGMIWGGGGELSNNIIYNWYDRALTVRPQSGSAVDAYVINNLVKRGPQTPKDSEPVHIETDSGSAVVSRDNYLIAKANGRIGDAIRQSNSTLGSPDFDHPTDTSVSILEMARPGSRHMRCVGATRPARDSQDKRVIGEFYAGTGNIGIIDHAVPASWFDFEEGASVGHQNPSVHNATVQRDYGEYSRSQRDANYDRDDDGMADEWEMSCGLDPKDTTDAQKDADGDGYTNLEEFLAFQARCE